MTNIITISSLSTFLPLDIGRRVSYNVMGAIPSNDYFELVKQLSIKVFSLLPTNFSKYTPIRSTVPNELFFTTPILKNNHKISKFENLLSPPIYS